MNMYTRDRESDENMATAACACIGPERGKKLCPCAIRLMRKKVARGDCLVCGEIGGHGGLPCPELSLTCSQPPQSANGGEA